MKNFRKWTFRIVVVALIAWTAFLPESHQGGAFDPSTYVPSPSESVDILWSLLWYGFLLVIGLIVAGFAIGIPWTICSDFVFPLFYRTKEAAVVRRVMFVVTIFLLLSYLGMLNWLVGGSPSWEQLFNFAFFLDSGPVGYIRPILLTVAGLVFLFALVMASVPSDGVRTYNEPGDPNHIRGRRLIPFTVAKKKAEALLGKAKSIFFGFLDIPERIATTHFAVVGATGSGKTLLLTMLMKSVLPRIGKGNDCRALVYDAKQDALSTLSGICPDVEILTLNPFDKRSVAWDMARDITAPATAQQIASILIPENKNSAQPFFADASRHLLSGVLISFMLRSPGAWTFRDVLVAMKSRSRLKEVLSNCPQTSQLVEQYFSDDTTARNVMSTVATKMQRYEFIAAAWAKADRAISLRDWLQEESILVLGNDEASRSAIDAINQVIFKRLSELILAQTESETRKTWIFFDELREAGKLDGLSSLLTKGRSKGACCVLGFQDIEGLRDVYGYNVAHEIVGLCANKAILRLDSPETAKWASSIFGERELMERRHTENVSRTTDRDRGVILIPNLISKNEGISTSEQHVKREVVMASELLAQEPPSPTGTLSGYYLIPSIGSYFVKIKGSYISEVLPPKAIEIADIELRDESDQILEDWNGSDTTRLCLGCERTTVEMPESKESDCATNPLFQITRRQVEEIEPVRAE